MTTSIVNEIKIHNDQLTRLISNAVFSNRIPSGADLTEITTRAQEIVRLGKVIKKSTVN